MRRFLFILSVCMMFWGLQSSVLAAELPFPVRQAMVWVHCDNRQGSGVVVNNDKGYILTNAHVLIDIKTRVPGQCEVGFIQENSGGLPAVFYNAHAVKYVFDEPTNRDFAVLQLDGPEDVETISPLPFVKTDEFSQVGDPLSTVTYPATAKGKQITTTGSIQSLDQGLIHTDAEIAPGSSGGAAIDTDNNLIGLTTGILYEQHDDGSLTKISSELVDVRAILNWMDTFGPNAHDEYITHADYDRYHSPQAMIDDQLLQCTTLARIATNPTVYCLRPDNTRFVFPNAVTYQSWFGDFSGVQTVDLATLANYQLHANITIKPGSLVKIPTDPHVYLVTNATGNLKWIRSEDDAKKLFGDGWAGFVKDVPVEFFTNYHVVE